MTKGLVRYYGIAHLHFITCSCYRRQPQVPLRRTRICREAETFSSAHYRTGSGRSLGGDEGRQTAFCKVSEVWSGSTFRSGDWRSKRVRRKALLTKAARSAHSFAKYANEWGTRIVTQRLDCETRDARLLHGCSASRKVNIPALSQRTRQGRGTLGVRIVERVCQPAPHCSSRTFGSQRSM